MANSLKNIAENDIKVVFNRLLNELDIVLVVNTETPTNSYYNNYQTHYVNGFIDTLNYKERKQPNTVNKQTIDMGEEIFQGFNWNID